MMTLPSIDEAERWCSLHGMHICSSHSDVALPDAGSDQPPEIFGRDFDILYFSTAAKAAAARGRGSYPILQ
eukprot:scaffold6743_cov118-Isochrysis_galbana.AAC.5